MGGTWTDDFRPSPCAVRLSEHEQNLQDEYFSEEHYQLQPFWHACPVGIPPGANLLLRPEPRVAGPKSLIQFVRRQFPIMPKQSRLPHPFPLLTAPMPPLLRTTPRARSACPVPRVTLPVTALKVTHVHLRNREICSDKWSQASLPMGGHRYGVVRVYRTCALGRPRQCIST